MARMLPDSTFYPSPTMASEAPAEGLAYVALLTTEQNGKADALGVVDTDPELLLGGRYGNALHVWIWKTRRHVRKLELGAEQQKVLELRPAHNPVDGGDDWVRAGDFG